MKRMLIALTAAAIAVPTLAFAGDAKEIIYVVGAIKDPAHVETGQNPADAAIPSLPVVYDNTAASTTDTTTTAQVSSTPHS